MFFVVFALTIAVVPIDFVMGIVFVNPLLTAVSVPVFCQRRTRPQENQCNQYYQ
jgi:hypothetical protein